MWEWIKCPEHFTSLYCCAELFCSPISYCGPGGVAGGEATAADLKMSPVSFRHNTASLLNNSADGGKNGEYPVGCAAYNYDSHVVVEKIVVISSTDQKRRAGKQEENFRSRLLCKQVCAYIVGWALHRWQNLLFRYFLFRTIRAKNAEAKSEKVDVKTKEKTAEETIAGTGDDKEKEKGLEDGEVEDSDEELSVVRLVNKKEREQKDKPTPASSGRGRRGRLTDSDRWVQIQN